MNSVGWIQRGGARLQRRASALTGRPLFWVLAVGAVAAWPVVWSASAPLPEALPIIATLPRFELADQSGAAFGSRDLDGRVWVASFIFTRCPSMCPRITATMARVQGRTRQLHPDFHLVSFSVDPEHDTPSRLSEYARAHRASPRAWTFLTGTPAAVRAAVEGGLKIAYGAEPSAPGGIFHTSHLVLVDRAGRMRGTYDSLDEADVDRLVRDVGWLVNTRP